MTRKRTKKQQPLPEPEANASDVLTDSDELLTHKQAANILGVAPMTIYNWMVRGQMKFFKSPSGMRRVRKSDVDRLLRAIKGSLNHPNSLARPTDDNEHYTGETLADGDKLISSVEAARQLRVTNSTVYQWMNKGLLHYFKLPGDMRRVRQSDIDECNKSLQYSFNQKDD